MLEKKGTPNECRTFKKMGKRTGNPGGREREEVLTV